MKSVWFLCCLFSLTGIANAEFRSAKDMQKECRVALDVVNNRVEKSFENVLFAGECIGYIQAAVDGAQTLKENVKWYSACPPESASTLAMIQKFIAFVDKYPKYTLAST